MAALEGEVTRLSWEEIVDRREAEDFFEDVRNHRDKVEDQIKAVGMLTFCVNQLQGITDGERGLLREMLMAAQTNTMALWGAMNLQRKEEVRNLFEKIKCLIG